MSELLVFPLPPNELRANSRAGLHWGKVNSSKNAYKLQCHEVIEAKVWGPDNNAYPVAVTMKAYITKRMSLDCSDLGFWGKTTIDCLVQDGIFKNDDYRHICPFISEATVGEPRIEISW